MIPDTLRPILGRLLAALLLPGLVKLFAWLGVPMPDTLPADVAEIALAYGLLAITHRAIDAKANPRDAASPAVVREDRAEAQADARAASAASEGVP